MLEKRFSYNPYTKQFIASDNLSHAIGLYNKGLTKEYDNFIRGIIYKDILYLRTYYPFEDLQDKTKADLFKASKILLQDSLDDVLALIKKEYKIKPKDIAYNAENDLLSGIGIVNI